MSPRGQLECRVLLLVQVSQVPPSFTLQNADLPSSLKQKGHYSSSPVKLVFALTVQREIGEKQGGFCAKPI